jgi:hypothetical protein
MSHPRSPRTTAAALAAALLVALPAASAEAQSRIRPAYTLSAGLSQFDLSGTGDAATFALRADVPLAPAVLLEGGVGVTRPPQDLGPAGRPHTTTLVVPEIGLQLQLPRRIAPYLGIASGAAIDLRGSEWGGTRSDYTLSGAAGLRAWMSDQVALRGELRLRGIGTGFEGAAAEWTLGVSWRP